MTTSDAPGSCGSSTVRHRFGFSASHELRLLPESHKCRRNHGHNYAVTFAATVPGHGFVDFSPFVAAVRADLDHRLLNDRVDFHPTCELLAVHLAAWFERFVGHGASSTLRELVVSETPATRARWDGATRSVSIAKTFSAGCAEVTVEVGADELDAVGFVTDFGDLAPVEAHLHTVSDRRTDQVRRGAAASLARWFIARIEPTIHGRLLSVSIHAKDTDEFWQRGNER